MERKRAGKGLLQLTEQTMNAPARAVLMLASCAVFFLFAKHARYAMLDEYASYRLDELLYITTVCFTAVFALTALAQRRFLKALPLGTCVLAMVVTGTTLLGKISLLDYVSDDYSIFLHNWIDAYVNMGIREGLGTYIGSDYTPPYLYLMLLISRIQGYPWQYLVKAISIAADALLAFGLASLVGLRIKSCKVQLAVFHTALLLPTAVFNGAYWGQCDAIYTGFCILALYMALSGRSARSMICFGVALSFKLQTVFFLPALLPLWLGRRVKLTHLVLIPAAYMAMMLPALWGGKSLNHVLTVYLQQAGNYNLITMNAASVYQFLPVETIGADKLYTMFANMALALGVCTLMVMCAVLCRYRKQVDEESTLLFAVLVLGGIPLMLPKMHERYMFGADMLSLVPAVYKPAKYWMLPLLYGFASYICYTEGLPGEAILELKWAAMLQLAATMIMGAALMDTLRTKAAAQQAEVKA